MSHKRGFTVTDLVVLIIKTTTKKVKTLLTPWMLELSLIRILYQPSYII